MIQVNVSFPRYNTLKNLSIKFPKNLERKTQAATLKFAKKVQKSAKLRAPRWTGNLASNIVLTTPKANVIRIESKADYGGYQELGYASHLVNYLAHPELLEWQKDKYGSMGKKGTGFGGTQGHNFFVRKFKPYIGPALQKHKINLPREMKRAIEESIQLSMK